MPDTKTATNASGDAPVKAVSVGTGGRGKGGKPEPEPEEPEKTPSELAREAAEYRSFMRKQKKRKWPEISKAVLKLRTWRPPPPPKRPPPVVVERPEITTRRWVPPYMRRRRKRPKNLRIPPEQITQPLPIPPECSKLRRIWHNFTQVDRNKMMLMGSVACNNKKYSSTACGSQTGCIAVVCRALLEEKPPALLNARDVDEVIDAGDKYYRQCMKAMKCYKGKPQLELHQLLPSFFLHDTKYTVKMDEADKGVLVKRPENSDKDPDLMTLMQKHANGDYMFILSVGSIKHFLIWGGKPDADAGSSVKTVCYIFDPHMLNDVGQLDPQQPEYLCCGQKGQMKFGCGAFLRYPGVNSFVVDFLMNHADWDAYKKGTRIPTVTLTDVEITEKEPLIREPTYTLDLKTLSPHCRTEFQAMDVNALIEKKMKEGEYPLGSLSAVSVATSRSKSRKKLADFYQKTPKEVPPALPLPPERPPPAPTVEQIMALRGENFFLYCPANDAHTYGRDDKIPLAKSETILHSPVEVEKVKYHSQYRQLDVERWILRGTRHFASMRYSTFKWFTGIPCCVGAIAMLRRYKARAWNEDTLDETLDVGYNLYRESLMARRGPIRRLVLGELKDNFKIRDREFYFKTRNIAVWGKLLTSNPKIYDLCRGIEQFFKESDSGVLQIPGEFEVAIWNEGGIYYVYHPWPADRYGCRVGLQDGGKACLIYFTRLGRLCEHFMENVMDMKKKPFSISDVMVFERKETLPEPVSNMKPIGPNRWLTRGSFHEEDERFPEDHRGKQATPTAITACALSHIVEPEEWTEQDIDEILSRGDSLYQSTMENLEKMGISLDSPASGEENPEEEEPTGSGMLSPADVLTRFKVSDYDCIEMEVVETTFDGSLNPHPEPPTMTLKAGLTKFFKDNTHGVFTARGKSTAIWKHKDHFYYFDSHACDENGLPSDDPMASACLVRVKSLKELADVLLGNLLPSTDDSYNITPVCISATKLNPELGAPETKLESKEYQWISKGTAAILTGPRGENSAIGKSADKCNIKDEDKAGRTLALPAVAAFAAASLTVPPPHMHHDHIFNFLDAGADYYLNHLKKTGRKDITVDDLTEKFEMGANTFSIDIGDPGLRQPLRLPDEPPPEGEEEGGGGGGKEEIEGEVEEEKIKEMKELLFKMWYDNTKPTTISLLLGDYHQLGVWMQAGGKIVAFDPAPTLLKGMLTSHRITKGDELRLQRIKDEKVIPEGEEPGDEEEEAEAGPTLVGRASISRSLEPVLGSFGLPTLFGGSFKQKPEPEPEPVPLDSHATLIVAATPGEFIDKLVFQGGLNKDQMIAPYKLYPVTVVNELTSIVKEKVPDTEAHGEEAEGEEEQLIPMLEEGAIGKYYTQVSRGVASLRGRVAQGENYFMEQPNRDNQDAANAVMGIVVHHIEPYIFWKAELVDAILKYGDRLYTLSLPRASNFPHLKPAEVIPEFHVTNFNVKLEVESDVVEGDTKASENGGVISLRKGLKQFFETGGFGVLCSKRYCVGLWKTADDLSYVMWEPHCVSPTGTTSPAGSAGAILFSTLEALSDTFKDNVDKLMRPGNNSFSISSVKVFWEYSKAPGDVTPQGIVPDEGYEWKVLTAYVEIARGRTILRGSRPDDMMKFIRESLLQSSCGAVVGAAMSHIRRPHLWTRRTVDDIMSVSHELFGKSLGSLGYEFRPGDDLLLPLQVSKRFILGVNYIRFDLDEIFTGKLDQQEPTAMTLRSALERFFEAYTHGIVWCAPYAVAVWRAPGAPAYYMMEPHACGATGLRVDGSDDYAACVLTFTSPKLMAFGYLQNVPATERTRHEFQLYAMSVVVAPIRGSSPKPLVRAPPGLPPAQAARIVPATSKVNVDGTKRVVDRDLVKRPQPTPSNTCMDAQRATENADKEQTKLQGHRNSAGWLILNDGTKFMSAQHSIACNRFTAGSRGNQALACSMMAVAMSRIEDVCRWCTSTLDDILDSGDQLYQDSYLHFKPKGKILTMEQVLRKFYAPGNCVCRVVVYQPRQTGVVDSNLMDKLLQFFREERMGIFVTHNGKFAVALFRTNRGVYMFDPMDRDRYGRAVAPPCVGKARSCLSYYPTVKQLSEKLGPNIPPMPIESHHKKSKASTTGILKDEKSEKRESHVKLEEPATFSLYGMDVSKLRKLNEHER